MKLKKDPNYVMPNNYVKVNGNTVLITKDLDEAVDKQKELIGEGKKDVTVTSPITDIGWQSKQPYQIKAGTLLNITGNTRPMNIRTLTSEELSHRLHTSGSQKAQMNTHLQVDADYALVPIDEDGIKYVYNRKPGDVLSCEIKISRSYPQLKRFMKFIQITFDMQEHFDNQESFRYWLTMKAGYFDTIVAPNGNAMFKAHSLAFDNMDEEVFKKVFSNCIDVFLKEYGNGLTEDALLEIVGFA